MQLAPLPLLVPLDTERRMKRLRDEPEFTDCEPSSLRQAAWTAAGWVALVVGLIVVLMLWPGGC